MSPIIDEIVENVFLEKTKYDLKNSLPFEERPNWELSDTWK